ncbi:MAG: thioredoxin-dependent thiol peroxidase [Beduini sp.]|uniref:thioredoxin-dependent thiol peroxidase n=1 Tax=Beduini sp. TaxID=1922300 RepID=UPI0011CCD542
MLQIGDQIPSLDYQLDNGDTGNLHDLLGKKSILFFYPKDSTPGCTKEACSINDHYQLLKDLGYTILGISPQNAKSKAKFKEKNHLTLDFICDEDTSIAQAFGVWQEKKLYGKTYMGVVRTTFVVDESGMITHLFNKVKVATHGQDLYETLKEG